MIGTRGFQAGDVVRWVVGAWNGTVCTNLTCNHSRVFIANVFFGFNQKTHVLFACIMRSREYFVKLQLQNVSRAYGVDTW